MHSSGGGGGGAPGEVGTSVPLAYPPPPPRPHILTALYCFILPCGLGALETPGTDIVDDSIQGPGEGATHESAALQGHYSAPRPTPPPPPPPPAPPPPSYLH